MSSPIKIGIGSYTFTWAVGVPGYGVKRPLDAKDLVLRAHALGASVVQFADNLPLDVLSEGELREIEALANQLGIAVEVGARGLTRERLSDYIGLAERFGSKIIRFVIDSDDYEPTPKQVTETLLPLISRLEKMNIKLAIENHDRMSCSELVSIVTGCGSPNVGICLDTVNSLGVPEGTNEVISQLMPYTVNLHIKDFSIGRLEHRMGFKVEGAPAGKGVLDIPAIMTGLKTIGRCNSAILELWTPFGPTMEDTLQREKEWAAESMEYLKRIN